MKTFNVKEVATPLKNPPRGVVQRLKPGQLKGIRKPKSHYNLVGKTFFDTHNAK